MNAYDQLIKRCTCNRQDFEGVEICHIKNHFDKCFVVIARDRFLSGWGIAENKTAYQVVLCFNESQAQTIKRNLDGMKDFTHVQYFGLQYFLESKICTGKTQVTSLKNANRCPAWNGGYKVEVK